MKILALAVPFALIIGEANAQTPNNQLPLPTVAPAAPTEKVYIKLTADPSKIEYYGEGNPYVYYENYFWYPEEKATLVSGYTPVYWDGRYWYPSYLHPHYVYIKKQDPMYLLPVEPKGILEE